jgi:hypothetical protein
MPGALGRPGGPDDRVLSAWLRLSLGLVVTLLALLGGIWAWALLLADPSIWLPVVASLGAVLSAVGLILLLAVAANTRMPSREASPPANQQGDEDAHDHETAAMIGRRRHAS